MCNISQRRKLITFVLFLFAIVFLTLDIFRIPDALDLHGTCSTAYISADANGALSFVKDRVHVWKNRFPQTGQI